MRRCPSQITLDYRKDSRREICSVAPCLKQNFRKADLGLGILPPWQILPDASLPLNLNLVFTALKREQIRVYVGVSLYWNTSSVTVR